MRFFIRRHLCGEAPWKLDDCVLRPCGGE